MKNITKLILFITMIIAFSGLNVYAATVGDKLEQPEADWRRYDDTNSNITYDVGFGTLENYTDGFYFNNTAHTISAGNSQKIKFNFTGEKLRVIALASSNKSDKVYITIDGVTEHFSTNYNPSIRMAVVYEKVDLNNQEHVVTIHSDDSTTARVFHFDAIDIDASSELKPYDPSIIVNAPSAPTNLTATASSNSIVLNWDAVTDADSYTLLRSTTSGPVDTVIASNITTTTYTDTNVIPGVTYYYVVRAVKNSVESTDSNVASVMVENNVATLQIKLSTTDIYEYKMTMIDVTNFINWYTDRSNNIGLPFYTFPNSTNIEPYTKINECIIHDKVVWFKVKEYLK